MSNSLSQNIFELMDITSRDNIGDSEPTKPNIGHSPQVCSNCGKPLIYSTESEYICAFCNNNSAVMKTPKNGFVSIFNRNTIVTYNDLMSKSQKILPVKSYSEIFGVSEENIFVDVNNKKMIVDFAPTKFSDDETDYIGYNSIAVLQENVFVPNIIFVSDDNFLVSYRGKCYESNDVLLFHYLFEQISDISSIKFLAENMKATEIKILGELSEASIRKRFGKKVHGIIARHSGKIDKIRRHSGIKRVKKFLKKGSTRKRRAAKIGKRVFKDAITYALGV